MITKIISFYSDIGDNTYYSDNAIKFKTQCEILNISYDIEEIQSHQNWMLNCLNKPKFIMDKINKYRCPIIWMDIDTILINAFSEFDNCDCDIGFIIATEKLISIKASPIYFNYTNNSIKLIQDWLNICENAQKNNLIELDHDALRYDVLLKHKDQLQMKILSEKYFQKYLLNQEAPYSLKPNNIYNKIANINNQRYKT